MIAFLWFNISDTYCPEQFTKQCWKNPRTFSLAFKILENLDKIHFRHKTLSKIWIFAVWNSKLPHKLVYKPHSCRKHNPALLKNKDKIIRSLSYTHNWSFGFYCSMKTALNDSYRRIFSVVKKRPSHVFAVSESCRELFKQILVLSVNLKIWKLVIPIFN